MFATGGWRVGRIAGVDIYLHPSLVFIVVIVVLGRWAEFSRFSRIQTPALAGLAAVVYTSRLGAAQNITGIGWELDAIAATVIGGTLLTGGAGFVLGSVVGALVLGLMTVRVLSEVLGREVSARLVYDAPHNLIWPDDRNADLHLHRKGACPALGADATLAASPFRFTGHPVIIPGSMGAASYLLAGTGNDAALCSACHRPPLFHDFTYQGLGFTATTWDQGRAEVTKNPAHAGLFRTPTLRNVGLREPLGLMHDGAGVFAQSIDALIAEYAKGARLAPNTSIWIQPFSLTPEESAALAAFVRDALTDPRVQSELPPFDRPKLSSE